MPVIIRHKNFKICVYLKDHGGIHAHVILKDGSKAKIYIDGSVESAAGFTRKDLKIAIQLVKKYSNEIINAWREYNEED